MITRSALHSNSASATRDTIAKRYLEAPTAGRSETAVSASNAPAADAAAIGRRPPRRRRGVGTAATPSRGSDDASTRRARRARLRRRASRGRGEHTRRRPIAGRARRARARARRRDAERHLERDTAMTSRARHGRRRAATSGRAARRGLTLRPSRRAGRGVPRDAQVAIRAETNARPQVASSPLRPMSSLFPSARARIKQDFSESRYPARFVDSVRFGFINMIDKVKITQSAQSKNIPKIKRMRVCDSRSFLDCRLAVDFSPARVSLAAYRGTVERGVPLHCAFDLLFRH